MPKHIVRLLPAVVAVSLATTVGFAVTSDATTPSLSSSGDSATTAQVVTAANAFLATLTTTEQDAVTYDYSDSTDKHKWSNLPTTLTGRPGIKLADMTSTQKAAALAVVQAMLSNQGYTEEEQIRLADDNLNANGGGSAYGSGLYYIAFYGTPSTSSPFMVQYGGHHLAVNADFQSDSVSITPEFVGVEPQTFTANSTTYSPMSGEKTAVFNLLGSLDSTQLASAKLSGTFSDVVMGAGADSGNYPTNAGILVSSLTTAQQALVTAVIQQWVEDFPSDVAADYLSSYTSNYDQTYIGWGNTTDSTANAYFRISGPRAWIEYIHQPGIVYPGQYHIHTVFRDKAYDYSASGTSSSSAVSSTTSLKSSSAKTPYGKAAKVTVTVGSSSTTPTGTVTVYDKGTALATGTLSGGSVTVTLPNTMSVGKHTLTAVYAGSSSVATSTSSAVKLTVTKARSKTNAALADSTIGHGAHAVVNVGVRPGKLKPTGRVRVLVDGEAITAVKLKAARKGRVSVKLPTLGAGSHTVQVVYSGSKDVAGSRSKAQTLHVG